MMSADDHMHPGSAYMYTDEFTDSEIGRVNGSLHRIQVQSYNNNNSMRTNLPLRENGFAQRTRSR